MDDRTLYRDPKYDASGSMPPRAPLAMAYVPFQQPGRRYTDEKALQRGTIYPGLALPFKGYENRGSLPKSPLNDVMTTGFILHELGLYLDTHPDDADACELYGQYLVKDAKNRKQFTEKYGPLTKSDACLVKNGWLRDPWPWEYTERGGY